jgi:hypothetical protein
LAITTDHNSNQDKNSLSFTGLHKENGYENWFFSNFIQMHTQTENSDTDLPIDFFTGYTRMSYRNLCNPFLIINSIDKDLLFNLSNPISFFINYINEGFYIDIILDEYYIPNRAAYNKKNYEHQNLVYGYDKEQGIFYLYGFTDKRFFNTSTISFQQLCHALYHSYVMTGNYYDELIFMVKYQSPAKYFNLNINVIYSFLEDYLYSRNSYLRLDFCQMKEDRKYGMDVYNRITNMIKKNPKDIRPLHLLWEHKNCMVKRINFLYQQHFFSEDQYEYLLNISKSLEALALQSRNRLMKYNIDLKDNIIDLISNNMKIIKHTDKELVYNMLKYLK